MAVPHRYRGCSWAALLRRRSKFVASSDVVPRADGGRHGRHSGAASPLRHRSAGCRPPKARAKARCWLLAGSCLLKGGEDFCLISVGRRTIDVQEEIRSRHTLWPEALSRGMCVCVCVIQCIGASLPPVVSAPMVGSSGFASGFDLGLLSDGRLPPAPLHYLVHLFAPVSTSSGTWPHSFVHAWLALCCFRSAAS